LSSVSFFNSLIPLDCLGLAVDISFHWPPGDGNSQLHRAQTQSETQANWTQPNWTELSVEQRSNLVIPVAVVVILMVFLLLLVPLTFAWLMRAAPTTTFSDVVFVVSLKVSIWGHQLQFSSSWLLLLLVGARLSLDFSWSMLRTQREKYRKYINSNNSGTKKYY